jgi:peptidyl-prolyl cis-trans isomerase C
MRALKASRVVSDMADRIEISEQDIQDAYNDRFSEFTPATEYNASHILVETQEEAEAVIAELDEGADFAKLAEAKSIGPTGPNGGLLGWFGPGRMVPEFEGAVMALRIGSISAPVKTQFGWHVIRLNETRDPEKPTLVEIQEELQKELWRARLDKEILTMVDVVKVDRIDTTTISPVIIGRIDLIQP